MSRAYRIRVSESCKRIIRAEDCVCTQLEILDILPNDAMSALLMEELLRRGFEARNDKLVRSDPASGIMLSVDPKTGAVEVKSSASESVQLEAEKSALVFEEQNRQAVNQVREAARKELSAALNESQAAATRELQAKVTDRLEGALGEVRRELEQALNRVTAEALKQRAAQIGQIKQMTEDPQSGSLTIVVEV